MAFLIAGIALCIFGRAQVAGMGTFPAPRISEYYVLLKASAVCPPWAGVLQGYLCPYET